MLLYVDETESSNYFIVTGLLVNSKEDVELAFKRFKKWVTGVPMPNDVKTKLYTEFKSTIVDRRYKKIKIAMLSELALFNLSIIYSCYIKKELHFSQKEKERAYINLISKIASSIPLDTQVIFDRFNKPAFEENIIKKLLSFKHIVKVTPADSQTESGLKFVDNLCSVMRLHKTNSDKNNYFALIEKFVNEI